MGKTLALLCILAAPAGAYDLKGLGPGVDVEAARSAGLECMYSKCEGGLHLLTFGGIVKAHYTDSGTVTDLTFTALPHRYAELRAALVAKYGKPSSSVVLAKQNALGARIDSHVDTWTSADGEMILDEYTDLETMSLILRRVQPATLNAGI